MKLTNWSLLAAMLQAVSLLPHAGGAAPTLTIYNQNFAVVRDTVPLDLQRGINQISLTDTTAFVEPDSVVLRDPTGQRKLQILEQNYRADAASQGKLLSLYEGQTLDFLAQHKHSAEIIKGKVIRSGGAANSTSGAALPPIIEVDGKLRFVLPGLPLFPTLPTDTLLKPTLNWSLNADKAGPLNAELAYVTGGMNWDADYNVIAPEKGDLLDMVGWVNFNNQSGKSFENAHIKLMAGDVNKIQPNVGFVRDEVTTSVRIANARYASPQPAVTEKKFDEYHLYSIARPVTLRDREAKQVEFVRGAKIKSQRIYIYDGAKLDTNRYSYDNNQRERSYGNASNARVWVMREFKNSLINGLGIPLPKGRVRFYRRDTGGQLEFTGENMIDHTPKDETLRIYTGDAFDIVGERKQTAYKQDEQRSVWADESFEIRLRNHKTAPVEVRVLEHLYRSPNWTITAKSNAMLKTDSHTMEFRLQVPPNGEKVITYTVHYKW